jgi:pantoate--beta-alanine ligase
MALAIERRRDGLRATVAGWRREGASVGVVPTMGALHQGHLSLVRRAKAEADRVVVTLFVNPRQFNNPDDLAAYPRTEAADAAALAPLGVDLLYVPDDEQIYPPGFDTSIGVGGVEVGLEDAFRPGHFEGVATVVAKLLLQTAADRGFFGEKDFQQLMLVRKLVRDLDIPCAIVGCPTVREPDGLALSSRNLRLSAADRAAAPAAETLAAARARVLAAGFESVEYLELRREADLAPAADAAETVRLLAAAWLGGVRLIDNVRLPVARDGERAA